MRMTEYLNSIAPNTTKKFLSEIMYQFGIGVKEFEDKSLHGRLVEIHRYFGYSMTIDQGLTDKDIQERIKEIFIDYEELLLKYPSGVPDFLKRLKEMSNKEKTEYLDKHYQRQINISLCHALIKNGRFKSISLKDALIARVMSRIEQMSADNAKKALSEEQFWINTIKNFDPDEIAPF